MMNRMKPRPEAVEAAISKVRANMTRSLIKLVNAPTPMLAELYDARAKCSSSKLKALLALKDKMMAEKLFYAVRDSQTVMACLMNLERAEDSCHKAVCAHVEFATPDIYMF
jgi:hypothetical protein